MNLKGLAQQNMLVCNRCNHNVLFTQKMSTLASLLPDYAIPADARKAKEMELV